MQYLLYIHSCWHSITASLRTTVKVWLRLVQTLSVLLIMSNFWHQHQKGHSIFSSTLAIPWSCGLLVLFHSLLWLYCWLCYLQAQDLSSKARVLPKQQSTCQISSWHQPSQCFSSHCFQLLALSTRSCRVLVGLIRHLISFPSRYPLGLWSLWWIS